MRKRSFMRGQERTTNENNQVLLMQLGAAPYVLKLLDEGTPAAKDKAAGAV